MTSKNNLPEELDNKTILTNNKGKKSVDLNPAAIGGVAAVGAAAAAGVTAFAMGGDEDIAEVDANDEGVFEQAAGVINPVHEEKKEAQRQEEKAQQEQTPEETKEEPADDKPEDVTPGGTKTPDEKPIVPNDDDDIIADVDPEQAAAEITGEVELVDTNDIGGGANLEFHNADVVYTEEGEAMIYAEVHEAGSDEAMAAIIDVNADGEFDAIVDGEGNISEMPISVSVADIEMQNQNYDEYIAYNEGIDIDVNQDAGFDADVNFG